MKSKLFKSRLAVSLVEVIFSIGVILIGLLGVMSILPLAGNRAQDSVSLSVGAAFGESVFQSLSSQRLLSNNRLIQVVEFPPPADPLDGFSGLVVPPSSTGGAQQTMPPFCIDPLFVSGSGYFFYGPGGELPEAFRRFQFGAYSVRFFPFYGFNHDPTTDPSKPETFLEVLPPIMRRVGVWSPGANRPIIPELAFQLVESSDDLNFVRSADRSQSGYIRNMPAVVDESEATPDWQRYGSRVPTGEYTWIATVVPQQGNRYASVSIVVIRKRQRTLLVPAREAVNPQGNATDERLAYVSEASGFIGGAGGVVDLVSSAKTVSRLVSGDWLMLSTRSASGPVHRWYRVAAVDGDPEVGLATAENLRLNATGPAVAREIWRRRVYLDGPDFPFPPIIPTNPPTIPPTNTFATLVEGVVSVSEHIVQLQDF